MKNNLIRTILKNKIKRELSLCYSKDFVNDFISLLKDEELLHLYNFLDDFKDINDILDDKLQNFIKIYNFVKNHLISEKECPDEAENKKV